MAISKDRKLEMCPNAPKILAISQLSSLKYGGFFFLENFPKSSLDHVAWDFF
jgi:hypothetical protein